MEYFPSLMASDPLCDSEEAGVGLVPPVGRGASSTNIPFPPFCSNAHGGSLLSVPGIPVCFFKQIKVLSSETQEMGWLWLKAQREHGGDCTASLIGTLVPSLS